VVEIVSGTHCTYPRSVGKYYSRRVGVFALHHH